MYNTYMENTYIIVAKDDFGVIFSGTIYHFSDCFADVIDLFEEEGIDSVEVVMKEFAESMDCYLTKII